MTAFATSHEGTSLPLELPVNFPGWFHSFNLPAGQVYSGCKPFDILTAEADRILPADLQGKSVLDIGAWDGFFSFEAERRGARDILATDHFCWSGQGWGNRMGFEHIHALLDSRVRALDVDILDLNPTTLGRYDLVLFLGVFYHVKDPYSCLEAASAMCADQLVIETVTALEHETLPAMRLFKPAELNGDSSNFWAPNLPAVELMLRNFGFSHIESCLSPISDGITLDNSRFKFKKTKINPNLTRRMIIKARR